MKSFLPATFIVLLLCGCYKKDNSTLNTPCTGGCTVVQGRVTTLNNQPVAGAVVKILSYKGTSAYTGIIRNIAEVQSGQDGYYTARFALNEYETGSQPRAQVNMEYSFDEDQYTPLLKIHTDIILSSNNAPAFQNKEITITKDIYLSRKTTAGIRLTGFTMPRTQTNYFSATPLFKGGIYNYPVNGAAVVVESGNTFKEVPVAGNDTTWFRVMRSKPDTTTYRDTAVYTPIGRRTDVTFSF